MGHVAHDALVLERREDGRLSREPCALDVLMALEELHRSRQPCGAIDPAVNHPHPAPTDERPDLEATVEDLTLAHERFATASRPRPSASPRSYHRAAGS